MTGGSIPGRPAKVITVGSVLAVLVGVALWDGGALLYGGDAAVATPTWAVLHAFPGARLVGLTYIVIGLAVAFGLGFTARPLVLIWAVTFAAWVYAMVLVSFLVSWSWTWPDIVITAPTKPAALAALFWLVRRALLPSKARGAGS